MWKLLQRSPAGILSQLKRGKRRAGSGFPSPKRALLRTPLPGGTNCRMGEEGWGSWPGERRRYLWLAVVLSICPFVASGAGGREGNRNERVLARPGCLPAAAAILGPGREEVCEGVRAAKGSYGHFPNKYIFLSP